MNSEKENIFNYIITNKDISFFIFNCSTDSYLTINVDNLMEISSLPGIISFIEKENVKKIYLNTHIYDGFDYNITIINIFDNQLEEGDIIIDSASQSISMTEKSILFHHNSGEKYITNKKL